MKKQAYLFRCLFAVAGILAGTTTFAQNIPAVPDPVCAYCGAKMNAPHSSGCQYYVAPSGSSGAVSSAVAAASLNSTVKSMVTGAVMQSFLNAVFAPANPAAEAQKQQQAALAAQQAAQAKKLADALAQARYEEMMKSYKSIGSTGAAFKSLETASQPALMSGRLEDMAASIQKPFDTAGEGFVSDTLKVGGGTPFFGDVMPAEDLNLLIEPENDPSVVDLRDAKTFIADNLKNDSLSIASDISRYTEKGGPVETTPDCGKLAARLKGYVNQRAQFQKTVYLAKDQLDTWETANRNALLNVVKDGISYFSGALLENFNKRAEAAGRLATIYESKSAQMAAKGLNVADIEAKIKRLQLLSSAGQMNEMISNISDWQSFLSNGFQSLMGQLSSSNQEINSMLQDSTMQEYFGEEAPALNALLDISKIAASGEVFGKWVAKKMPVVAYAELAVNQSYNALDWLLSYKRIKEANKINGGVLETARYIQNNINNTYAALKDCP
ncbi:MAG: hypothetical protein AAGU19_02370 [Prolixibacteraceae bacterium]